MIYPRNLSDSAFGSWQIARGGGVVGDVLAWNNNKQEQLCGYRICVSGLIYYDNVTEESMIYIIIRNSVTLNL